MESLKAKPFEAISPKLNPVQLDRYLTVLDMETVWKWTLMAQDELIRPYELQFLDGCRAYKEAQTVLDLAWGKGVAFTSRVQEFSPKQVHAVPIPMAYLFQGKAKANQILQDITFSLDRDKKFDLVRVNLVVQHIRQHGVFLKGLREMLSGEGSACIIDAKDELLDFFPNTPLVRKMYEDLRNLQKTSGGHRAAADIIRKRASMFGFQLEETKIVQCASRNSNEKLAFFQMLCLHIEVITRSFQGRFDRQGLFSNALAWFESQEAWGSIGLHFLIIRKKRQRSKARLKK